MEKITNVKRKQEICETAPVKFSDAHLTRLFSQRETGRGISMTGHPVSAWKVVVKFYVILSGKEPFVFISAN
jgi:hypothetical protein